MFTGTACRFSCHTNSIFSLTPRFFSRNYKSRLLEKPKTVQICGVPLAFGQDSSGVCKGPGVIRNEGQLTDQLIHDGWKVEDLGDLDFSSLMFGDKDNNSFKANYSNYVGQACEIVSKKVERSARQKKFALSLGGDHSLSIGSIAGVLQEYPNLGSIIVGAHADINTPTSSNTGNIHGMVFGLLMDLHNSKKTPGFEWLQDIPRFPFEHMVYIGLRDCDEAEKILIKELGIKAYTMYEIDKYGIGTVMEQAMYHARGRANRPLHLAIDIDCLDPVFAPSTGTRVKGGLTYREAYFMTEKISRTRQLVSMDLVEVNPKVCTPESVKKTADIARGLVISALGNTVL